MKLSIASALARRHMTQTALADMIGVKKGFMSEIISGKKSPSLETLISIATALEVSMGELFTDDQWPASAPADRPTGFGENEATPFTWSDPEQGTTPQELISYASDALRHSVTYQLHVSLPSLGLIANDILVVDIGTPPSDNDLILVGVTNADGFQTRTVIRRFFRQMAISCDPADPEPIYDLDRSGVASWRGTVRASVRVFHRN